MAVALFGWENALVVPAEVKLSGILTRNRLVALDPLLRDGVAASAIPLLAAAAMLVGLIPTLN